MATSREYRFSLGGSWGGHGDVGFVFSVRAPSQDVAITYANTLLHIHTPDVFDVVMAVNELPGDMMYPCVCLNTSRVLTENDICDVTDVGENDSNI